MTWKDEGHVPIQAETKDEKRKTKGRKTKDENKKKVQKN